MDEDTREGLIVLASQIIDAINDGNAREAINLLDELREELENVE